MYKQLGEMQLPLDFKENLFKNVLNDPTCLRREIIASRGVSWTPTLTYILI